MKSIKKYKAIILLLVLIIAILLLGTRSQAFTFSPSYTNVIDHNFNPYKADGSFTFYCVQRGSPYKVNLPAGYKEGDIHSDTWCPKCEEPKAKPWSDAEKKTMTYENFGPVNDRYYQDAAYVMASAVENGKIEDMVTQWSLWNTTLNIGRHDNVNTDDPTKNVWGKEAVAYRNFYNTIHNGTSDIYNSKLYDKTDINSVTVEVNQTEKSYIVGPFVIEYPRGEYGTQKWSYITNISLLDQTGNSVGNVVNNTIHIIDSSGNEVRDTINNNNFPNSNVAFYVKFSSTLGDISNIKLKVDFKYLESCSATLQRYKGTLTSWVWEEVKLTKKCPNDGYYLHSWRLKTEVGGTPQELVAFQYMENEQRYSGSASKNYNTASLIIAPSGIDLSMKISGQVFLDVDSGKVNTGNNIMDGKQEALKGVEVVLYDKDTNKVVTKTNKISQYHIHTAECYQEVEHEHIGDPYLGGGCYIRRIHTHDGNWETGGACYSGAATHIHTGTPSGVVKQHVHTDECYSNGHKHTDECYVVENGGYCYCTEHEIGTWQGVGHCQWAEQKGDRVDWHPLKKLICEKTEVTGSKGELICGYENGQNEIVGDGCYTKPVYHTHTEDCFVTTGHVHEGNRETGGGCYTKKVSALICTNAPSPYTYKQCPNCGYNNTSDKTSGEHYITYDCTKCGKKGLVQISGWCYDCNKGWRIWTRR